MRLVRDGETLSGHGNDVDIMIFDGVGGGSGSLVCTIASFHEAKVTVHPEGTPMLTITGPGQKPVEITVAPGSVVMYGDVE